MRMCPAGKTFLPSFLDVLEVVEEYIRFYNEERPQLRLQGLSPVAFRQQAATI